MRVLGILVACVVAFADGGLAPFITPCKTSDAACHLSSIERAIPMLAAGVPALGLGPMDPMLISRVKADQAGLKVEFKDTVVKGLRNCQVLSFKRNGHRHNVELQCSVSLVGNYTIGGRLLILPIEGRGKYKIKIRDIIVKVQYEIGEKSVGSEQYWNIDSWKYTSDVKGGAEFHFQNLFNGNQELSDRVHEFANANWRDIFEEVAPPIVKAIVGRIVDDVGKFFHKVPLPELTLD